MSNLPHWTLSCCALFHTIIGFCAFYYLSLLNPIEFDIKSFTNASIISHYSYVLSASQLSWFWSFLSSSIFLGQILGSISVVFTVDKGRKLTSILLKNLVLITAAAFHYTSRKFNFVELLLIGRILAGVSMAQTFVLPLLLSESSPDQFRGLVSSLPCAAGPRLWTMVGSITALPQIWGCASDWSILSLFVVAPAILHLLSYKIIHESPRHILTQIPRGNQSVFYIYMKSLKSLLFYHGPIENPVEILEQYAADLQHQTRTVSFWEIIQKRQYRWPAALSIICWITIPLGGCDVALQYSTGIMVSFGVHEKQAQLFTPLVLLLPSLFISIISSLLADKVGRRPLLLTGVSLMTIGQVLLFLKLFDGRVGSVVGLCLIIFGLSVGPGTVSPILPAELCPQAIRGKCVSLATGTDFVLAYIILLCFPPLKDAVGNYAFLPLIVANSLCLLFLAKYLPETKKRSVSEICETWRNDNNEEYEELL